MQFFNYLESVAKLCFDSVWMLQECSRGVKLLQLEIFHDYIFVFDLKRVEPNFFALIAARSFVLNAR